MFHFLYSSVDPLSAILTSGFESYEMLVHMLKIQLCDVGMRNVFSVLLFVCMLEGRTLTERFCTAFFAKGPM